MISCARRTRTPDMGGSAWSVLVLAEGGTPETQRWIASHAGPLLPERARNADHISRSRAVLVQGRSRTSMATTPSRGDTSPLGWSIETRARWTDQAILGELNERAWKDNLYSRCAPGQSARRWEIDCSQSVGWVGEKVCAGWAGEITICSLSAIVDVSGCIGSDDG